VSRGKGKEKKEKSASIVDWPAFVVAAPVRAPPSVCLLDGEGGRERSTLRNAYGVLVGPTHVGAVVGVTGKEEGREGGIILTGRKPPASTRTNDAVLGTRGTGTGREGKKGLRAEWRTSAPILHEGQVFFKHSQRRKRRLALPGPLLRTVVLEEGRSLADFYIYLAGVHGDFGC